MQEAGNIQPEYSGKQIRIIEATEHLFAINGFEGTSVRDIAQEAGVNVAMISYYFGSKEKLLEAVFHHRVSSGRIMLENLVQDEGLEPMEKIKRLINGYVDRILSNQAFFRMMIREQMTLSQTGAMAMVQKAKAHNHELLKKIIQEGQRKKVFSRHIDFSMLVHTFFGTLHHIIATQHYYRHQEKLEHLSEEAFKEHLNKKLKAHFIKLFISTLTYEG